MKGEQLSLFDRAADNPKPESQTAIPVKELATYDELIELAVELAGGHMRKPINLRTLTSWIERFGIKHVREALVSRGCAQHLNGPGDRRYLARWEWMLFGPWEEVFAAAL